MFYDYIDDENVLTTIINVTSVVPVKNGLYQLVKSSTAGNTLVKSTQFIEVRSS